MAYTAASYLRDVARGVVDGATLFSAFGHANFSGTTGEQFFDIWDGIDVAGGVQFQPLLSGDGVDVTVYGGAGDTASGTGIRTLKIIYLDPQLEPKSSIVTLNGATGVTTNVGDIYFVQCAHAASWGSGRVASADITIQNSGTTYKTIKQYGVRCRSSVRMVPAGKRLMVAGAGAGATSGAAADIQLVASELDGTQLDPTGVIPQADGIMQDATYGFGTLFELPMPFKEGTVVRMQGKVDKAAIATASYRGWLEDVSDAA